MNKFYLNISKHLIYFYLLIFPIGQLLKIPLPNFGLVNLSDLIVLLFIPILVLLNKKTPANYKNLFGLLGIMIFSYLVSLFVFNLDTFRGIIYLIRFSSYICFSLVAYLVIDANQIKRSTLYIYLLIVIIITAVIGWLQYLIIPDLRFLRNFGWDDHLNRLTGTFLDPAFTGIIVLFGVIFVTAEYLKSKKKSYLFLALFLVITVFLTYSRASILAMIVAITYLGFKKSILSRKVVVVGLLVIPSIFLLVPKKEGEGTKFGRTQSIYAKLDNYKESVAIIRKAPLLGVGFDNLCSIRSKLYESNSVSHSCSGLDSSLLHILATTGVIGLIVFFDSINKTCRYVKRDSYGLILSSCFVAVLIHSLFVQSMFYPYILGFIGLLYALSSEAKDYT